ncbi:N-acetylmuramoyl-L-alanine amidase [Streptomyces sp. NPDC059875]|uniref:N-acetylmuramoyl-L-alanine amidase n=1 Tax=unclassified Streptomyces TaxID=2593676 RepID=UPI00364B0FD6
MTHGRAPSRRGVLVGTGAMLVGFLGIAAVAVGIEASDVRRVDRTGVVDQATGQWVAASDANFRYAGRPDDYSIDRIVVHVTQSRFTDATRASQDPQHRAAAHYVVRASDVQVAQTVREADVAYHAGNREWNEHSVGIEHEGFVDDPDRWFTDAAK